MPHKFHLHTVPIREGTYNEATEEDVSFAEGWAWYKGQNEQDEYFILPLWEGDDESFAEMITEAQDEYRCSKCFIQFLKDARAFECPEYGQLEMVIVMLAPEDRW